MHLIKNNNPVNTYILDGAELDSVVSEKDLGLTVNNGLNFDEHIKNSLAKANKIIGWVSRNVICKSKEVMGVIYRCAFIAVYSTYGYSCDVI